MLWSSLLILSSFNLHFVNIFRDHWNANTEIHIWNILEVHWEKNSLSGSFLQLIVECRGIRAQMAQGVLEKLGYANVVNGMTWGNVQETIDQLPQWGMASQSAGQDLNTAWPPEFVLIPIMWSWLQCWDSSTGGNLGL